MSDREIKLRMIAQSEADYALSNFEFMSVIEAAEDVGIEITDEEARFIHRLVLDAVAELPTNINLEGYTA